MVAKTLFILFLLHVCGQHYPRRLCRSAWVGFSSPSVRLSVCLFVRSITRRRMTTLQGMILGYPRSSMFWVQRSKVKVTGSITLHNNTSFRTTITFHSHSLGGDTSTITLQPRFVVIRYSLGGDTDNSNKAWVRTL